LARDEELEATIAEAQTQLLSIRDNAIDDIERRLSDQTDDLSVMIEMSRQRAIELDQGLQEVSRTLDGFDHQLPALTEGLAELAAKLVENRTILDRAAEEIAALDGKAPPLLQAVETHQESLEGGSQTLAVLQAQLEALKTQTVRSSHQLDQVLDEGRARVADWESVEREIDQRKQGIMQNLDHYADSLNARVREFIEVLNNAPTFTGG
jgi:chromosome segregation ATPase